MSVTYATAAKTARMTATRDHFANGTLEIQAADNTVLVVFGLDATGGSIAGAIWTLGFDATTVAATAGAPTTATKAQLKTSGASANLTGLTVGLTGSGEDIELDAVSITSGQNVTLTSGSITHAA